MECRTKSLPDKNLPVSFIEAGQKPYLEKTGPDKNPSHEITGANEKPSCEI
ncbi:hypothetical protein DPMN_060381 [Dreissena polymorpha]|uniref:Uncharacterized protein n=1 Tax=Dreissena polymorpha TaxID=45954 RepID=A0A9D4HHH8_DREPO|nr:hypothetical protein DPMN_060381 [Dreissena polymorpha]